MPVTQDRLSRLREFGLSEYAARSYLALLDLGIAEARDVSSISKVPQAKIYHVLEQLHEKGLVVILPEFPKKYAPVPFEEYLGRLYDEHTKAAQAIDDQRGELAELFRVMGDTDVGDRGFFTVIRGRRNVLAKIEEIIAQAKRDIVILGTAGTAARAAHMLPELRRARERDVRVRIMTPVDAETVERLEQVAQAADLRPRDLGEEEQSAKVAIVISDASRAFLIHFVPDDANLYTGKDIGVFTDQEAMVAAIQAIVEPHWDRAPTYERRRAEILEGRDPEFTRVYASAADAAPVVDAALARAKRALVVDAAERAPHERAMVQRLLATGPSCRALLNLRDAAAIEDHVELLRKQPRAQLRHLDAPSVSGQLVLDEREAFFTVAGAASEAGSEIVIHTNVRSVVGRLVEHFETLWGLSEELEDRRRELEIFPDLQPGDVGLGRLFPLLRDALIVSDDAGAVVLWNPAAATAFGRSAAQVRGKPLASLIAPDARKAFEEEVTRFLSRAESERETGFFETRATRADGSPFPCEVTLSTLPGPQGKRYLLVVGRDISVRRLAQERAQRA